MAGGRYVKRPFWGDAFGESSYGDIPYTAGTILPEYANLPGF